MVSRETTGWELDSFFRWYEKCVLNKYPKKTGPLSAEAAAITLLSVSINRDGLVVIISPNEKTASALYSVCYGLCPDFSFFLPEQGSPRGGVPGFVSESQRYIEESLSALSTKSRFGLIFTTNKALCGLSAPPVRTNDEEINVYIKKKKKMVDVLSFLDRWGYHQTDRVVNPLYYAVRGGIIDVFLFHSRNPVRIEYFGDTVESIRLFNPYSQRTIKKLKQIAFLPRLLEKQTTSESLFSFVSSDSSINIYSVERCGGGDYQILFNKEDGDVSCLKSENISKGVVNNALSENTKTTCVVFSDKPGEFTLPSYFPEKHTVQQVFGSIENGFYLSVPGLIVFGSKDLSGSHFNIKSRWMVDGGHSGVASEIIDISDLGWGEPLVHEDFGIGIYRGLEKTGGNECIKLKYADGGAVYVPVYSFNKLHRLVGVSPGSVKLSSLRLKSWSRKKGVIKKHAKRIAKELLKNHALRLGSRGFLYEKEGDFYRAVCESFPFQETGGQLSAMQDVMSDMGKRPPMDRLICGDVGFGKTEIAIRASIRAVESGRLVFVMAPTTVLANQHYISFTKRFFPLGVHVELLSRFRTKTEQKKIIASVSRGNVDVLIGTHRLISDDVHTDNLGLVVIDEEHRFGVKHKEKIKSMRSQVDVLTLTATPIPRTLKQSIVGLKNISIISTPPKSRRPIKTFVGYFDWERVFKIIKHETNRGGQVYFVNNNIRALSFLAKKIKKRFPNLKTQIAHGKTKSRVLESVMLDFFKNSIDVLCCTTIVGSGLDVSNANSIIINNAHHFGLSQLYQLRGRVGRSVQQAFCYLFVPVGARLGGASFQRLKALEQNTSLGSGYKIAQRDMDIRGAGDLFGTKQSGAISSVGFHMYNKILKAVIDEERGVKKEDSSTIIVSGFSSDLPKGFVPLIEDRLYFYQSLALAGSLEKVGDIKEELVDRFGPLPRRAALLLEISRLRVFLSGTSVKRVCVRKKNIELTVSSFAPFETVVDFIAAVSSVFSITNKNILLKNNKDKSALVVISGVLVTYSSIKKIFGFIEKLFLKRDAH